MSFITSIFSLKKDFSKIIDTEKVRGVFEKAKTLIIAYKEYSKLTGEEKKARVDEALSEYIRSQFDSDNKIIQWLLDRLLAFLPVITQCVYDHLKENVKGITDGFAD